MRIFFQDRVVTSEPCHIKAMLATQFDDFEKGESILAVMQPLLGTGVCANDGDLWNITRPFSNRDRITYFDIFDRHANEAIRKMKTRFAEGYAADFQVMSASIDTRQLIVSRMSSPGLSRFTLDSASELLFGHDIGTLSDPLPYPFFHSSHSASDDSTFAFGQTFSARFSRLFNFDT
ncbi:hypothetical protein C8R42DRAFT_400068 [Lentinula raphanica]|nr:hypothetical protein C8R42DRAFT_400068 [Lentinula raphanica]